MRASKAMVAAAAAVGSILLAAGCTSSGSSNGTRPAGSTATSAAAFGGMAGLIAAAKREGQLNVTTLPSNWANYGTIMRTFTAKYGIKITDSNPEGSSQDELNAVKQLKGSGSAPDVVDIDSSSAAAGAAAGDWAPYRVATWNDIPTWARAGNGDYAAAYGGYMAIGYRPDTVTVAPTSFRSLLTGDYRNEVAIDGLPTQFGSALGAVYAASLASGGSLANIAPGVSYFQNLERAANFAGIRGTSGTMQSGQTPILIWWEYMLISAVKPVVKNLRVVIPPDGVFQSYFNQAISATAPHPAAARLWEEFLYSTEGQNLFIQASMRPIEWRTMLAAGTINKGAYESLPKVPTNAVQQLPTASQQAAAAAVVARLWPSVTGTSTSTSTGTATSGG